MGILNITEDSFSDGGDFLNLERAVDKALEMIDSGVDIIDIGAESSRPGAKEIPEKIELGRVSSLVKKIKSLRPSSFLSIDTTKYEVARTSLELGAGMLNDISGLRFEPKLAQLCKEYDVPIILMHMKGEPKSMQSNPIYENVVSEVFDFLQKQKELALSEGAKKVLVDVGIGFGKNDTHNKTLLQNIEKFNNIAPQVLGISRKSFIGRGFGIDNPKDRDMATIFFHSLLLDANIEIIRVHDIKSALLLKNIFTYLHS